MSNVVGLLDTEQIAKRASRRVWRGLPKYRRCWKTSNKETTTPSPSRNCQDVNEAVTTDIRACFGANSVSRDLGAGNRRFESSQGGESVTCDRFSARKRSSEHISVGLIEAAMRATNPVQKSAITGRYPSLCGGNGQSVPT